MDERKTVTNEAVEAATEAMFEVFTGENEHGDVYVQENSPTSWIVDGRVDLPYLINRILEAAAPHMLAQAWDEGAEAEFDRSKFDPLPTNPYRSQS